MVQVERVVEVNLMVLHITVIIQILDLKAFLLAIELFCILLDILRILLSMNPVLRQMLCLNGSNSPILTMWVGMMDA